MLAINSDKSMHGFRLTFANGWTASVQFGYGNYCENRHEEAAQPMCENAEIAAFDRNKVWYRFEGDEVQGYTDADEVARFLKMVSEFPDDARLVNAVREVHDE